MSVWLKFGLFFRTLIPTQVSRSTVGYFTQVIANIWLDECSLISSSVMSHDQTPGWSDCQMRTSVRQPGQVRQSWWAVNYQSTFNFSGLVQYLSLSRRQESWCWGWSPHTVTAFLALHSSHHSLHWEAADFTMARHTTMGRYVSGHLIFIFKQKTFSIFNYTQPHNYNGRQLKTIVMTWGLPTSEAINKCLITGGVT